MTRRQLPIILVRGFGGLSVEDERRIAYQGFNDGTVYPQKRGENYIYEGMVLRFLKSDWSYHDATNVVGYYPDTVASSPDLGAYLNDADAVVSAKFQAMQEADCFSGSKIVIDPAMALRLLRAKTDVSRSLWIFRYYDLSERQFATYGQALVRLIRFIQILATPAGATPITVNLIAHSMGGLIVREAIQRTMAAGEAAQAINKVVTLGTPHQGIAFQIVGNWLPQIKAEQELEAFNPEWQANEKNPSSYKRLGEHFPLERFLTVVGTNYRTYSVGVASGLNRLSSIASGTLAYNRSDGLVKQDLAQIPGCPRTFVHKCHGGVDSLVTSREAYEIATRFFFGNVRIRLRLVSGKITRGKDAFGKSEFFFGLSVKPRRVDFELFHQSPEAENSYGPFGTDDLTDPGELANWADDNRLIWEGYLNTTQILEDASITAKDLVLRLDLHVSERDTYGIGFSDNIVFRKQYYLRAAFDSSSADGLAITLHDREDFTTSGLKLEKHANQWHAPFSGTGFAGVLGIELDEVPEEGPPVPFSKAKAPSITSTAAPPGN